MEKVINEKDNIYTSHSLPLPALGKQNEVEYNVHRKVFAYIELNNHCMKFGDPL